MAAAQYSWNAKPCAGNGTAHSPPAAMRIRQKQKWKRVDPIARFKSKVLACGIPECYLAGLANEIQAEISSAVEFAVQSPLPDASSLYEGIFVD
jgi:TPP-dependent pyruvate/acetoin dehydrogenase alpha subunit